MSPRHPVTQDSFSEIISNYPIGKTRRGVTLIGGADENDDDWTVYVVKREQQQGDGGATPPFVVSVRLEVQTGRGRSAAFVDEAMTIGSPTAAFSRGFCMHFAATELKVTAEITVSNPPRPTQLTCWASRGRAVERRICVGAQLVPAANLLALTTPPINLAQVGFTYTVIPTFARAFRVVTSDPGNTMDAWAFLNITGGPNGMFSAATSTINPTQGEWMPIPANATLVVFGSSVMVAPSAICYVEWLIES